MAVGSTAILRVRLFGPFSCHLGNGQEPVRLSAKNAAMLALLATSPEGARTRAWLQEMLWFRSGAELGRASLRQALSALRRAFGDSFDQLLSADNKTVRLQTGVVEFVGKPHDGQFLEGIDIAGADSFTRWLHEQRQTLAVGRPALVTSDGLSVLPADVSLRPTIAVLPFVSGSESRTLNEVGDMMATDVSRQLSRAPGLNVISHISCRNTAFRESGTLELRSKYNVDYLATGHARRRGDQIVVNVDFIDVSSGSIAETETFLAPINQVMQGYTDWSQEIASFLARSIFNSSVRTAAKRGVRDTAAHILLMSAIALMHRQDLASFSRAREQLEEIVKRAPTSLPLAWLAKWYVLWVSQGWSNDLEGDAARAFDNVSRALESDPGCSFSLAVAGFVEHQLLKNYDQATRRFDLALAGNENNALAWLLKGAMFAFEGSGPEAVAVTERARHLSPLGPSSYLFATISATAHLANNEFQAALDLANESLALNRNHVSSYRARVVALHQLGKPVEAKAAATELMRIEPDLTVDKYLSKHAAADFKTGQEWARAFRDSGVPKK